MPARRRPSRKLELCTAWTQRGIDAELTSHVAGARPADDSATEQVDDHGQEEPALAGADLRDVRDPSVIGHLGFEISLYEVGGEWTACR